LRASAVCESTDGTPVALGWRFQVASECHVANAGGSAPLA